jgi:hypothetical protein
LQNYVQVDVLTGHRVGNTFLEAGSETGNITKQLQDTLDSGDIFADRVDEKSGVVGVEASTQPCRAQTNRGDDMLLS